LGAGHQRKRNGNCNGIMIARAEQEWQRLLAQRRNVSVRRRPNEQHSQAWREDAGLWVPDGWLKPGWFADPPQFDPLPGERLKTPAFPGADFRAAAATGPVDVVIPLGTGSRHGDAELRYALRSIERHVENLGRVWVIGHRPAWLRGVEHLPADDADSCKDRNILAKIEAACRAGVSERFLFWSDDQVILRPLAFLQFGPYTWGDAPAANGKANRWHRRLAATGDWLRRQGFSCWHGDTHTPIPMERERLLELAELCREDWWRDDGFTIGTWYLNAAELQPAALGDRKATVEGYCRSEEIRKRLAGRWFLGFNDAGFTRELRGLLDELFPDRSQFEEPVIRVKPAGPTLSVIVPTIGRESLGRTLKSISGQQLIVGDEVLLVQDGPEDDAVRRVFRESGLPAKYLATGKRAADFGGTPRNLGMARARGAYLAFMDDDDVYRPGAFAAIRREAARHPGRPLMFRMERPGLGSTVWQQQAIGLGNVGTPMIVVPNVEGRLARWPGHRCTDLGFAVETSRLYRPGAFRFEPAVIATVTGQHVRPRPMRRNLLYHVYAVAANDEWRLNVQELLAHWSVFNGRKIVGIASDNRTVPAAEVKADFGADPTIQWLPVWNDPRVGERPTFCTGLDLLRSIDPDEATYYAHAKGVTNGCARGVRPNRRHLIVPTVRRWRREMYARDLGGDAAARDNVLRAFPCSGTWFYRGNTGRHEEAGYGPAWWHYAGTFFWINHAHYFGHPRALEVRPNRWGPEYHLGSLFAPEAAHHHLELTANGDRARFYDATEAEWEGILHRAEQEANAT